MAHQSVSFPVPNAFEVLCAQYAERLPARLEDLAGPAHGTIDLPLHVAWSGRRSYTLEQPRSRMGLYRTVLAEGQHQHLIDCLDRDLLLAQWPVLRTLISRPARHAWETAFPELATATTAAEPEYPAPSAPGRRPDHRHALPPGPTDALRSAQPGPQSIRDVQRRIEPDTDKKVPRLER